MDPVTIGVATAALLATSFANGAATKAGEATWGLVQRLLTAVKGGLEHDATASAAVERIAANERRPDDELLTSRAIATVAASNPEFAVRLRDLLNEARDSHSQHTFVAQAFDEARQVNIQGDNSGSISFG